MNERQRELLRWLDDEQWKTPMHVGGFSGSHHSNTLMSLVKLGYADTKKRHAIYCPNGMLVNGRPYKGCRCKGSRRYRRTKAGRDFILGEEILDAATKKRWARR